MDSWIHNGAFDVPQRSCVRFWMSTITLATGSVIEYVIDGANRRIGKKVQETTRRL
jgi:hypothetical protein